MITCHLVPPPDPRIAEREKAMSNLVALLAFGIVFFAGALTTLAIVALIAIVK
ncbi:MAG: hypothetical protein MJ016_02270 [Victivallaceae bacterium]|nr:hypothetical protein [Victivallaceae bacterium]